MHKLTSIIAVCFLLLSGDRPFAQNLRFKEAIKNPSGAIIDVIQDKQGIFWFAALEKGLIRYDGVNIKTYINDNRNPNSIAAKYAIRVYADKDNIVWVGTLGAGLERFDPSTNIFTHIRHDPKNVSGLNNDTVSAFLEDRSGNFWVGTFGGLSLMDRKTGKFSHYRHDPNDPTTISHNQVFEIYEDKNGTLWLYAAKSELTTGVISGSLNRFDRSTGKFTRYVKDPANPGIILPGPIRNFFEDRKNNFWMGTDSGLYNMDRKSNKFTRYYTDPFKSGPLGQTPLAQKISPAVPIVRGDSSGALWVGLLGGGLIRYDADNKTSMHFGAVYENDKLISSKDTSNGFVSGFPFKAISSKEGLFWVIDNRGVYYLNYNKTFIPFYSIGDKGANAFYHEAKENILWVATDKGLLRKDLTNKKEKLFVNDPQNSNTITAGSVSSMRVDASGNVWLGTRGGLDKFDPATG
ncbi:MAG TPA: two-component regulator propeller domain-containing protein, partial [Chitinophagaceae bacterium]